METLLQFDEYGGGPTQSGGHNPYFSGNSFAIKTPLLTNSYKTSHNPYFSGNSFAILKNVDVYNKRLRSQSLF